MCSIIFIIQNIDIIEITIWTTISTLKCILVQILIWPPICYIIIKTTLSSNSTNFFIITVIPKVLTLTNTCIASCNFITYIVTIYCLLSICTSISTTTVFHINFIFLFIYTIILTRTLNSLWNDFIIVLTFRCLRSIFL